MGTTILSRTQRRLTTGRSLWTSACQMTSDSTQAVIVQSSARFEAQTFYSLFYRLESLFVTGVHNAPGTILLPMSRSMFAHGPVFNTHIWQRAKARECAAPACNWEGQCNFADRSISTLRPHYRPVNPLQGRTKIRTLVPAVRYETY